MIISAKLANSVSQNEITVSTNDQEKTLNIPGKSTGRGSSVNGGELLFTALATCCCNDIYREAARRKIEIEKIDVVVSGQFGGEGEPASGIVYQVKVKAPAHTQQEIDALVQHVDQIAEIHNTLRQGARVVLNQ